MENTSTQTSGTSKGKIHRGWIVLFTVGLYYATVCGVMTNCIGILFASIIEDMKFKTSELSIFYTVKAIVAAVVLQRLCRIFDTCRRPNIFMALNGVVTVLCFAAMTIFTKVWQWWILAVVMALAAAEMTYVVSVTINNWFYRNQGTIIGFTLMSSGISAAIFGPICSSVISKFGWKAACFTIAAVGIVGWVIPCLLLFARSPQDVGEQPVGYSETASDIKTEANVTKRKTPSALIWIILAVGIALPGSVTTINAFLPAFATSIGYTLATGAVIASCSMIGNMMFKPLLGFVADRIGAFNATRLFLSATALGLVCIMAAHSSVYVIYAGAFIFGALYACTGTAPSIICKEIYGDELYKARLSKCQSAMTLICAFASFAFSKMYDVFGTWTPVFMVCVGICVFAIICLTIVNVSTRQRRPA